VKSHAQLSEQQIFLGVFAVTHSPAGNLFCSVVSAFSQQQCCYALIMGHAQLDEQQIFLGVFAVTMATCFAQQH